MGELFTDLLNEVSTLFRKEVQLARAEVSEKVGQLGTAVAEIAAGAIMLAVSLGILLSAMVSGVARLLVGIFGGTDGARELVAVEGLDANSTAIVTAVNENVGVALDAARTLPAYEGLAALIVGTIFAIIGVVLMKKGVNQMSLSSLTPDRTIHQVSRDAEV
ncbi:MAG: phage holin family protein, partial [Pseudomonadota bacterium]